MVGMPTWILWVAFGVAIVVIPIVIGMVFSSGRNMYGGPGTSGGGMFGPFEEIFAPSRHEAGKELEQQKLRRADAGAPDGPNPGTDPESASESDSESTHVVDASTRDHRRTAAAAPKPVVGPGMSDDPAHIVTNAPPAGWLDGKREPPR